MIHWAVTGLFHQGDWRWEDGSLFNYHQWESISFPEHFQCLQLSSQSEKRNHTCVIFLLLNMIHNILLSLWCFYRFQGLVQSRLQHTPPICVSEQSKLLVTTLLLTSTDTEAVHITVCDWCLYLFLLCLSLSKSARMNKYYYWAVVHLSRQKQALDSQSIYCTVMMYCH